VRRGEPVHLVGHSFGGWIAFEMALQLTAANVAVRSLTIIDSEAPGGIGVLGCEYTQAEVLAELVRVMELSTGASLGVDLEALRAASRGEQLRLLHEGMVRVGLMPRRSSPASLQGLTRTFGTALRTTYRPAYAHRGRVGLVLARDPHLDDASHARVQAQTLEGWRRWAPDLRPWTTPADHFSVLRPPHVGAVADWWRTTIAAA
jgi:thioesterase domain-containing protein